MLPLICGIIFRLKAVEFCPLWVRKPWSVLDKIKPATTIINFSNSKNNHYNVGECTSFNHRHPECPSLFYGARD